MSIIRLHLWPFASASVIKLGLCPYLQLIDCFKQRHMYLIVALDVVQNLHNSTFVIWFTRLLMLSVVSHRCDSQSCVLTFNIGEIVKHTVFLDIAFVSHFDVCATGAVYFHRFYMFHSFTNFHRYVRLFCLSVTFLLLSAYLHRRGYVIIQVSDYVCPSLVAVGGPYAV